MFRASPWITYEPASGNENRNLALPPGHHPAHYNPAAHTQYTIMNTDVDMGTPQISTLREEETPPPQPSRGKFRVNLLVGEKSGSTGPSISSGKPRAESDEEEDELEQDELEEDQLIDDDDEAIQLKRTLSVTIPPPAKPKPRKRARKSEKIEPKIEASGDVWDPQHNASISDNTPAKPPQKKKVPRKPAVPKPKVKVAPKLVKSLAIPQLEDVDALSESYAGTTPSSPVPHDANTPELDLPGISNAIPVDINLDGVALPVYPLPSKPYPVQPPPKIPTGFAPVIPLDKSTNKPRRWRTANREIRGIAGGRWFARTWVGEKDSELTSAAVNAAAAAAITKANVETDKRASAHGSVFSRGGPETPSATPSLKLPSKPRAIRSQAGASVATSRAASIVSDAHAPRAPTKMRNILGPASEADSDMAPPGP